MKSNITQYFTLDIQKVGECCNSTKTHWFTLVSNRLILAFLLRKPKGAAAVHYVTVILLFVLNMLAKHNALMLIFYDSYFHLNQKFKNSLFKQKYNFRKIVTKLSLFIFFVYWKGKRPVIQKTKIKWNRFVLLF